jgi:predicted RNase H-like HicB family nuclease
VLDTVGISLRLLCTIKQEGRNKWVTGCPKLDLFSQGKTEEEAKSSLREAIALWVEDCLERGTLEQALEECGFHKVHPTEILPGDEHITRFIPCQRIRTEKTSSPSISKFLPIKPQP